MPTPFQCRLPQVLGRGYIVCSVLVLTTEVRDARKESQDVRLPRLLPRLSLLFSTLSNWGSRSTEIIPWKDPPRTCVEVLSFQYLRSTTLKSVELSSHRTVTPRLHYSFFQKGQGKLPVDMGDILTGSGYRGPGPLRLSSYRTFHCFASPHSYTNVPTPFHAGQGNLHPRSRSVDPSTGGELLG